ncbi:conserved hypothetical protein [Anaeromyxobacter sp. K]|uniref:Mpo1-like protein n=1 Tax=Anaeromyxobacter sp. (strain K) TaxID=447217 RepID=UPI00015F928C|nr:Mpo1-like protein [Anaeromyxobacter sp. K]ACG75086.1 conserved hypothetical protein [Anaeromyxobacter sp. K]
MSANEPGVLERQWAGYGDVHRDRLNLALHGATVPLFWLGTCALALAPVIPIGWAMAGVAALLVALAAQGRGHRGEARAPAPFRGPGEFLARILAEQWITFPRYVLSGGFARAWREAATERPRA